MEKIALLEARMVGGSPSAVSPPASIPFLTGNSNSGSHGHIGSLDHTGSRSGSASGISGRSFKKCFTESEDDDVGKYTIVAHPKDKKQKIVPHINQDSHDDEFEIQEIPAAQFMADPTSHRRRRKSSRSLPLQDTVSKLEEKLEQERRDFQDKLTAVVAQKESHEEELNKLQRNYLQLEREMARMKVRDSKGLRILSDLLTENAKRERFDLRAKLRRNSVRLGHVSVDRARNVLREVWEEGQEYYDIQEKLNNILQQIQTFEKKQKELADPNSSKSEADPAATNEILICKLQMLQQSKGDLMATLKKYEADKLLYIRELKRTMDEDGSRFNKFQVLNARYALQNLLGKGGFSEVYKAFDLQDLSWVACKLHQVYPDWSEEKKRNYVHHSIREYQIHQQLMHPNIVRLSDVFEVDQNTFCTVLELCEGHDLDAILKANPWLPENQVQCIAGQVVEGLKYLNRPGQHSIIHYDLKPANILFDLEGRAKITDFGLSKIMDSGSSSLGMELTSQGAGTYWYLPPECFSVDDRPKVSSKVDVWSVGVVVFQMLYGVRPYGHNQSQQSILMNNTIVNARDISFPDAPPVSDCAKDFVRKCLTYEQRQRPDVFAISQHPFLSR